MMKKTLTISLIVSAAILVSGIIQNNAIAYPQQKQGYSYDDKMMKPGSYAFGTIASLQNDENGNPIWIVSGLYKASLSMNNKTQGGAATGSLPNATVDSKFNMVMTNGSAMHDHEIYDFILTDMSMPKNSTTVFNGTATITMRQGPVPDVPVSIKAMENNAVSIWVEPTKIQNHFGNTPIFGTIEKLLEVAK
jgi:CheY-like chemotaxis protein